MSYAGKPVRYRHDDALTRVSWDEFERLIADHYRRQGYRVEHTGTGGSGYRTDGGIDIKLHRDQELIVVQCKHWVANQVPHNDVHQLIGVMHTVGATGAIVITSGEFTTAAIEAAAKFRHIKLIDGMTVRAMLGHVSEPEQARVPLDDLPPWIQSARTTRRSPPARTQAVAAVAAAIVMTVVLGVLYAVYIREIQRAQMDAIATTSARASRAIAHVAEAQAASRALFTPTHPTSTINGRPAIVHDTPIAHADVAEWERKNAESMRILEKTTPSMP